MLKPEIKDILLQLYKDVGEIINIKGVEGGYTSDNQVIVCKNQKFFLKQYNQNYTAEKVEDIVKVSEYFFSNNIPIVLPIKNNQQQSYFKASSNIYSLFPFVETTSTDKKRDKKENITSLAKTLAKMHLLSSKGIPVQINSYQKTVDKQKFLNTYTEIMNVLKSKKKLDEFDELALKGLELKKLIVTESSDKENQSISNYFNHLLHGDYHDRNVFFNKSGNVEYIFDLDNTHIGNRLSELVRSMDLICLNMDYHSKENLEKAKLYIHTYKEMYPFEKEDFRIALKEYLLWVAYTLWIESKHYLQNNSRVNCFLDNEVRLLGYLPNKLETFIKNIEI